MEWKGASSFVNAGRGCGDDADADGFWHLSDDDDISQSAPLADCYHDECRVTALSPCVARFPYNEFSGDVQMMSLFSLSVKGHSLFYTQTQRVRPLKLKRKLTTPAYLSNLTHEGATP